MRYFFETLYLVAWLYLLASSLVLYEFMARPDEENWLLPMQLFFKITLEGWLYFASIVFISYRVYKKSSAKGRLSFIPFR